MLYRKYLSIYTFNFLIFYKFTTVNGLLDPITGGVVLGSFVVGYVLRNQNYSFLNFGMCPTKNIVYQGKILILKLYTFFFVYSTLSF